MTTESSACHYSASAQMHGEPACFLWEMGFSVGLSMKSPPTRSRAVGKCARWSLVAIFFSVGVRHKVSCLVRMISPFVRQVP